MIVATTATIGTFNILSTMARWFVSGCLIINHMIESRTLRRRYLLNFDSRRANMWRIVYQSDIASIVTIRMNRLAFSKLCKLLESKGEICNSKHMLVDEQVAVFLHTLAHNGKNRVIINRFERSSETISRYFKLVLDPICRLRKEFYVTPVPVPNDETDERWKWFKGYLSVLDGTYINVRVPTVDRKPYRTRKGSICTNVLAVCTRDLMFTHVLAGWEGSKADS
uniref:uncharacterized protein LOC122602422 n=1 Tax=Erigeron canadensis TaxID=72917 RepID=UPI001CB89B9D|nr:uncharacterized protein LOC122602422 [Erigeron canadensis]